MLRALVGVLSKESTPVARGVTTPIQRQLHANTSVHTHPSSTSSSSLTVPQYTEEMFRKRKQLLERAPDLAESEKLDQQAMRRLVEKLAEHQEGRKKFSAY